MGVVFAALQFHLQAKPSDVAFQLQASRENLWGWDPRRCFGEQVYGHWQQALMEEEFRRHESKTRSKTRRKRKEQKKMKQIERALEAANHSESSRISINRNGSTEEEKNNENEEGREEFTSSTATNMVDLSNPHLLHLLLFYCKLSDTEGTLEYKMHKTIMIILQNKK
jgi:hypothetical protein